MGREPRRDATVTFLADHMVGRLATWLRILGVDTATLREGRILLTRDKPLYERLPETLRFFVRYQHYPDQIKEVLRAYPEVFHKPNIFTRCTECNTLLREIPKPAPPLIPAGVQEREQCFWQCPCCQKIFWRGSHYDNAVRFLEAAQQEPLTARWRF